MFQIETQTLLEGLSVLNAAALAFFLLSEGLGRLLSRRRSAPASRAPVRRAQASPPDDPFAAWIAEVERGEREQWARGR